MSRSTCWIHRSSTNMHFLRNLSIERKIQGVIMLAASVAPVLTIGMFLAWNFVVFRDNMRNDQLALALIVGGRSSAAMSFNDPKAASEILEALRAKPHLIAAGIYAADGNLLAGYTRFPR